MSDRFETIDFVSDSLAQTRMLGQLISRHLVPGSVLGIQGTLGAGKTNLVQAIAEALEIDRSQVTSPTFALIQQYTGTLNIVHIDTYRISDEDEFVELGIDEFLGGDQVVLIEWADRFPELLPVDRLSIAISVLDEAVRRVQLSWPLLGHQSAVVGNAIRNDLESGSDVWAIKDFGNLPSVWQSTGRRR